MLSKKLAFYTHFTANWATSRDFEIKVMIFQKRFRETSFVCLWEMLINHSHSMATLINFGGKISEIAQSSFFMFSWNMKNASGECIVFNPYHSGEAQLCSATASDGTLLIKWNKNSCFMKGPRYYKNQRLNNWTENYLSWFSQTVIQV